MMIYIVWGEDTAAKDAKIAEIKGKVLPSREAVEFDSQSLDAFELKPVDLKKALLSLPAVAKQRLVLVQNCHKLNTALKDIILDVSKRRYPHLVLILETPQEEIKDSFYKSLAASAQAFQCGEERKTTVFDVTKAMTAKRPVDALKILSELLGHGQHPLQVMGGLIWYWGQMRAQLSRDRFNKGLFVLRETDLNIKRSRIEPDYALEIAVLKLSSLLAY